MGWWLRPRYYHNTRTGVTTWTSPVEVYRGGSPWTEHVHAKSQARYWCALWAVVVVVVVSIIIAVASHQIDADCGQRGGAWTIRKPRCTVRRPCVRPRYNHETGVSSWTRPPKLAQPSAEAHSPCPAPSPASSPAPSPATPTSASVGKSDRPGVILEKGRVRVRGRPSTSKTRPKLRTDRQAVIRS